MGLVDEQRRITPIRNAPLLPEQIKLVHSQPVNQNLLGRAKLGT